MCFCHITIMSVNRRNSRCITLIDDFLYDTAYVRSRIAISSTIRRTNSKTVVFLEVRERASQTTRDFNLKFDTMFHIATDIDVAGLEYCLNAYKDFIHQLYMD